MKKTIAFLVCICMTLFSMTAMCESTTPPAKPEGDMVQPSGDPPEMPDGEAPSGEMPQMPDGSEAPDGQMPGGEAPNGQGGMPGGQSGAPESYSAVMSLSENTDLTGEALVSTDTDENALLVTDGTVNLTDSTVERTSEDSTGGDNSSFYGVGAALLCTNGVLNVSNTAITTDANGGAGVFAYGTGIVNVSDTTIATTSDASGAIHVAGGGTLYAENVTATTEGNSSAAIRSDRGGGTMYVQGGSFTSNGTGSPAIYVTADITVEDADLTATHSEALCLEGLNNVSLTNCTLSGNMQDDAQNDNTWTVILYQSMSGDAEVGKGTFTMTDGTLVSNNGGVFYTTNTESEFTLKNVAIETADDCEYILRCTGNANQRGWGNTGSNGADCTFNAIQQTLKGDVIWDSISNLDLSLTEGSTLEGTILDDESCAGEGGSGTCSVTLDADSTWIVTADSVLTTLQSAGSIVDADGNLVTIQNANGEVLRQGDSAVVVTVENYIEG